MSNLLQQLESTEAVLLMYLADELPPEDRAEVERRLVADAGMRAGLERLRDAQESFEALMPVLDRATRVPVPQAVGVRRVVTAMRRWQVEGLARPAPAPQRPTLRYPWWAYPLAAAASVVIASVVWWGNSPERAEKRYAQNLSLHFDVDERPTGPDFLAAMILDTSKPLDPPEEFAALVESSDDAVLLPLMGDADALQPNQKEPSEIEREQDDWYLFL